MERLTRFDVLAHGAVLMVVVESDLLPPDPAIVVIPLLQAYPAVRHLNPEIEIVGQRLVLATRLIASVRRTGLTRIGNVTAQGERITRAVDVLMGGI